VNVTRVEYKLGLRLQIVGQGLLDELSTKVWISAGGIARQFDAKLSPVDLHHRAAFTTVERPCDGETSALQERRSMFDHLGAELVNGEWLRAELRRCS
jgi:hypothetical protein